jgi:hypothetical protein
MATNGVVDPDPDPAFQVNQAGVLMTKNLRRKKYNWKMFFSLFDQN